MHIDFGFMLSNAPGGHVYSGGVETAPFKLTADYLDVLLVDDFTIMFTKGLLAVRKHQDRLLALINVYSDDQDDPCTRLPCLQSGLDAVTVALKQRLFPAQTDKQVHQQVEKLFTHSAMNTFTRLYDAYQYYSNGIL